MPRGRPGPAPPDRSITRVSPGQHAQQRLQQGSRSVVDACARARLVCAIVGELSEPRAHVQPDAMMTAPSPPAGTSDRSPATFSAPRRTQHVFDQHVVRPLHAGRHTGLFGQRHRDGASPPSSGKPARHLRRAEQDTERQAGPRWGDPAAALPAAAGGLRFGDDHTVPSGAPSRARSASTAFVLSALLQDGDLEAVMTQRRRGVSRPAAADYQGRSSGPPHQAATALRKHRYVQFMSAATAARASGRPRHPHDRRQARLAARPHRGSRPRRIAEGHRSSALQRQDDPLASGSRRSWIRDHSWRPTPSPGTARATSGWNRNRPAGDGCVTGYGTVDGRPVCVFSHDVTVFGGLARRGLRPEESSR